MATPFWKPPVFGPGGRERQWINACFSIHDTFCGCETPASHLRYCLAENPTALSMETCLSTEGPIKLGTGPEPADHSTGDAEENLDAATLEALFGEPTEDPVDG